MAKIKSYTDIEQSKALSEILPLESADMYFTGNQSIIKPKEWEYENIPKIKGKYISFDDKRIFYPCWSLAALLGVLPEGTRLLKSTNISSISDIKYHCDCPKGNIDSWFDESVDACVAMIEHLHELKVL